MGERGPAPKRSEKRLGHRSKDDTTERAPGAAEVVVPEPSPAWHSIAVRWYVSLGESGASAYYEPADWSTAYAMADAMSREFKPQPVVNRHGRPVADEDGNPIMVEVPPRAAFLTAWLKACAVLLATEGDRRRVQLELTRQGSQEANADDVSHLDDYRRRLESG